MAADQAFAVAFGLAFAVLGGLYVLVRSEQAAQRARENPTLEDSKFWLLAHRIVTIVVVGMLLIAGSWLLAHGQPNVPFAAGMATLFYAKGVSHAFGFSPARLRVTWSGYALAGLLCAAGSMIYGGPIGILGMAGSLAFSAFWLWMARMTWRM